MGAPGRKDDHDFMTDEEVKNFLRGPATGPQNNGRRALVALTKELKLKAPPEVLDAACGTAINWETFKEMQYPVKYTAMDRTRKMLSHAFELYGDEISYQQGHVQEVPFEDDSFDVVILRHIMEHLPGGDMEKAIEEALRVSRQDVIISFFLMPDNREEHDIQENSSNEGRDGCTHFWNTYSHQKLMDYLTSFGYIVTKYGPILTLGAAHPDTIYRISK